MAMKIILAYLLIGSYATLFWFWRQKRKAPPAAPLSGTPVSTA
jgi:cbb3-type cytochrome oxidase subunit 3